MRVCLIIVVLYTTSVFAGQYRYYPRLTLRKEKELLTIISNYSYFSDKQKIIAARRAIELKTESLPLQIRAKTILQQIKHSSISNLPISVTSYVNRYRSDYLNLDEKAEIAIIESQLTKQKIHNEQAIKYIASRKPFITITRKENNIKQKKTSKDPF